MRHNFKGTLRPEQSRVASKAMKVLQSHGSTVLVMPTGTGKTVTTLAIAASLGVKPMILVHKNFLAEQWKERIRQYLGDVTVSMIQGTMYDTSGDVIIGMIQTFVQRGYDFPRSSGTLVIDECHHIAANMFKRVMYKATHRYIIGLSATPDRNDGLDIYKLLGEPTTMEDTIPDRMPEGFIASPSTPAQSNSRVTVLACPYMSEEYMLEPPPRNRAGDVKYTTMVTRLTEDVTRTETLVNIVATHPKVQGKHTLILSHRRQHCEDIYRTCKKHNLDAGLFLAPTSRRKGMDLSPPSTRIIISTYAYVSEAFDVPRLECLILATPASNVQQAVGRVMRKMDDPSHHPVIIDIVDKWSIFNAQAYKRSAFYTSQRFVKKYFNQPRLVREQKPLFIADD
jgi:superfamily II DNA or RNA helicase